LSHAIGVVIVDAVTGAHFNLHNRLLDELTDPGPFAMDEGQYIYANAYRQIFREQVAQVEAWRLPLEVGKPLPTVPLYLKGKGWVPLNLEESYMDTRQRIRLN